MNRERLKIIKIRKAVARNRKTLSMVLSHQLMGGASVDCIGLFQANLSLWSAGDQHVVRY
jgi:hypothetical protein